MSRRRQERVTELIQQEISKLVPLLKDPGIGFVTILAVRLTPDFNQAKVFYSVFGTEDEKRRTHEALERARTYFRAKLKSLENLKYPPELQFVADNSAEEAQNVLKLISQLEHERQSSDPDVPPPSAASR
jgi:ribosome-binding factor A